MRAGHHSGHQDHVAGKNVKQRQRTHDVVMLLKEQFGAEPAVVDEPRIAVLGDFGHSGRSARVEVAGHTIFGAVGKAQGLRLLGHFFFKAQVCRLIFHSPLGPDQRNDPRFGRREIAQKIHLQHCLHIRRQGHGLGRFVRDVGFWERSQSDNDLGIGFPQNRPDLFRIQQRIDRVCDTCNRCSQQCVHCLIGIWQNVGHHVFFADTQTSEKVRGLCHLLFQLRPIQGFRLVRRT